MNKDKQKAALLQLIDDPDWEVYRAVANEIIHYGTAIVPELEQLWEFTDDDIVQKRIEVLIKRVLYADVKRSLTKWAEGEERSLFAVAMIISKYRYPEVDAAFWAAQYEQVKRNVWLELNNYLTPLEQINVINSILYSYYRLQGFELSELKINRFFLNHMLEKKQGNAYSIGLLYLALCSDLDVPIYAVSLPGQFILSYFDHFYHSSGRGLFFVDPVNGLVYSRSDIEAYLRKIGKQSDEHYFEALDNKQVAIKMLQELAKTYKLQGQTDEAQRIEALALILINE